MSKKHEISEYIDNLPLKKKFCRGYKANKVHEVICQLSTMYNELLSEMQAENDELKKRLEELSAEKVKRFVVVQDVAEAEEVEEVAEEVTEEAAETVQHTLSSKELQKLKRGELLEILLEQSKESDSLKIQLDEKNEKIKQLSSKLNERKINLKNAGTIAEASFQLNGVFDAAEKAAEQYLENLQELYEKENALYTTKEEEFNNRCASIMMATEERCAFMKEEAEKKCKEMLDDVEARCSQREKESEERCIALDQKAKEDVDKRWNSLATRLEEFYESHDGLREMLSTSKLA